MDCSTPGLPVHHQLPEPTQTHVHGVSEGKLRPERERLAPSQNADVQAGSCQSSQDRFCPNIGCSVSRPQGDLCISFPDLVHPVSTERSYPVGACLAPVDPLEASAPLHQGPPKVTLSLQFLQPSHPPESHLEAPPTQPSAFPNPTPGWNLSPLRALTCFILRGPHVVVFKVDPLPSLGFREEQGQRVHTQVCKLSENQAVWCVLDRRTQQIPQAGGNTRATTQGPQRRCRQDSCLTRRAVGTG